MRFPENDQERSHFCNNLLGLALIVLIFSQLLYGLQSYRILKGALKAVYMFVMPFTVFLAGYLLRSPKSRNTDSIITLIAAYLVVNGMAVIYTMSTKTSFSLLTPVFNLWLLSSTVIWIGAVSWQGENPYLFIFSLAASILIGFWPNKNNLFGIRYAFVYFPFFLLGFLLWDSQVKEVEQSIRSKRLRWIVLSFILFSGAALFYKATNAVTIDALQMFGYSSMKEVLGRIELFFIGVSGITVLVALIPRRQLPLLTKVGVNAMPVFLCSGFLCEFLIAIMKHLPKAFRKGWILLGLCALCTILCAAVLSSNIIRKLVDNCIGTAANLLKGAKIDRKNKPWLILFVTIALALALGPLFKFSNQQIREIQTAQQTQSASQKNKSQTKKQTSSSVGTTQTAKTK